MTEPITEEAWFEIIRIAAFPLMWIPINWKGWLAVFAFVAAIAGMICAAALLQLLPQYGAFVFLAVVLATVSFQLLVFAHAKAR